MKSNTKKEKKRFDQANHSNTGHFRPKTHLSTPNLNLPSFKGRLIKLDNKLFPKVNTKKESSTHNLGNCNLQFPQKLNKSAKEPCLLQSNIKNPTLPPKSPESGVTFHLVWFSRSPFKHRTRSFNNQTCLDHFITRLFHYSDGNCTLF